MREKAIPVCVCSRFTLFWLAVLLLPLFVAGCTLTEEKLEQKATRNLQKLKGVYAEVDAAVFSPEGIQEYQVKQWLQFPVRWRVQVTTEAGEQFFICDGEHVYVFHPGFDDHYRLSGDVAAELAPPFSLVAYLETYLKTETRTFMGKRTENDRSYYLVIYEHSGGNETVHLQLDEKTLFPTTVETYLNDQLLNRLTCTNFELNPDFGEDLFEYDAVGEAEVSSHCLIRPLSLDEAKNDWPYPIYTPQHLPKGCFLFVISQSEEDGRNQLAFIYKGDEHFSFIQRPKYDSSLYRAVATREVMIGNNSGYFHENQAGELATLWWSDEATEFILSGSLTLEEMLEVAESVKVTEEN